MSRNQAALFDRPEQLDALLVDNVELLLGLLAADGIVLRANRALATLCADPDGPEGRALWTGSWCEAAGLRPDDVRNAIERAALGERTSLSADLPASGDQGARRVELVFRSAGDRARHRRRYVAVEGRVTPADDAEAELAQLRHVFRRAPIGLALVDCACRFVRVNRSFGEMTGMPPDAHVGCTLREIVPDLADTLEVLYQAAMRQGQEVRGMTLRAKAPAGGTADRQWTLDLYPIAGEDGRPAGAIAAVIETTDVARAEMARIEREQQLKAFFESAPVGLFVLDHQLRFLRVNSLLAAMDGIPVDEHLGRRVGDLAPPYAQAVEQMYREFLESGGEPKSLEFSTGEPAQGGRCRHWSLSCFGIARGPSRSSWLGGMLMDVTEHKQATARILKLSRLYAAISETNKAIVRSATPEDVYRAVCHAGVEYGGFRLAWIGVADPDAERIVPVEAAGPATAFLDGLVVSTRDEVASGLGPTGRAYREQRVCRSADLRTEPDVAQLPELAAGIAVHGLACAISLPLRRGAAPFGTLTVYGHEPDFFDDEAVQLLRDMADNVSFALDLFDRENLRRQTEAALRASEARLQEAQAISKMGDWALERDTGKMSWSPQLFRLFERRMALGPPDINEALAYYAPESLDKTRDAFWHAIDNGERTEIEQVVQLPSGRTRYHLTVIVPVESSTGRVIRLYGTVQDITERKLAERELVRRTEEVEDLYQNAPCGYHSLDARKRIIRINDTALRWLGYSREEVFGRMKATDILAPESRAPFEADFRQIAASGASRTLELELLRKDGTTLPVLASSTALFNAEGEFVAARMTLADDSHRKQLERERAAYVSRLADLSQHLVEVQESERRQLASALHDQASPNLAALRITFNNLASALPQEILEDVEPLLDDAHALLHDTTSGIREICTSLRPATLDYAGLLPAVHEYAEQFSRRTGIAVVIDRTEFDARLPPNVQSLLFRITQEALTNCAKHALAKTIHVCLEATAKEVVLRIADDGVGFDPEQLSEPGATPGLGLIIMKERAEFAGGRFDLRSSPGTGTEVTVVFERPASPAARVSPAGSP